MELFKRGAEIFGRDDLEAALEITDPEVELIALRSATEGAFRGHEGIRAFFADNRESFEVFVPDYREFHYLGGGAILAIGTIRIRGRGSGVETDVSSAPIARFRDGLLVYFRDYGDADAAREAAGLA